MNVQLNQPVMTHKGEITSIELKLPTARCFRLNGMPYTPVTEYSASGETTRHEIRINTGPMFKFLEEMSGLDTLTLDGLDGISIQDCFAAVVNMLTSRGIQNPPMSSN